MTTSSDLLRCFVAVPLDDELRRCLAEAISALRAAHPGAAEPLRWTEPEGWHLTLAFLGETEPAAVAGIAAGLDRVAAAFPRELLSTGGIGAFPSPRLARVLWYGVRDPDRRLASIASAVRTTLGIFDTGPFRPHVTLARSRRRHGSPLTELVAAAQAAHAPHGELTVDRIILYRSRLGTGPARYEALHEAPLTGILATGAGIAPPAGAEASA